ncbi:MAG: tetratricopeptide repeat protein [Bdellovibrionia bacterium]
MIKQSLAAIIATVSILAVGLAHADEFDAFSEFLEEDGRSAPAKSNTPAKVASRETNTQKLQRLKKDFQKNPANYNLIIQIAEVLIEEKKTDDAQKILWRYVDKVPPRGLHLLAEIHITRNELDKAEKAANLAVANNENDHVGWTIKGRAKLKQKQEKTAMEAFNKAVSLKPDYEPAYLPLIDFYHGKKNYYELRIVLQDMIKNIGKRPHYYRQLCQLSIDDKTYEQALGICREGIGLDSTIPENHTNLGLAQLKTENEVEGMKTLETAAKKFSKSDYAQIQLALVLFEKKDFIKALQFFKRSVVANEKSAIGWTGLGESAFEIQKYEDSLGAFSKACKLDRSMAPKFRKAMITLRNANNREWTAAFEKASDQCVFGN